MSVQYMLCFLHEHVFFVQFPLHAHFISCSTASGAGGSTVVTGRSTSPSIH